MVDGRSWRLMSRIGSTPGVYEDDGFVSSDSFLEETAAELRTCHAVVREVSHVSHFFFGQQGSGSARGGKVHF